MGPRSNVALFSNVYLRDASCLSADTPFQKQVRGRVALMRLLAAVAPGSTLEAAARRYLEPWQRAELDRQVRCVDCSAFPLGTTRSDGTRVLEFRCPLGVCPQARAHRLVRLDFDVVKRFARHVIAPTHVAALQSLLNDGRIMPTPGYVQGGHADLRPYPARMSWTDYYVLTDADIEAEMIRRLGEFCDERD
jgi:hypothetical protein